MALIVAHLNAGIIVVSVLLGTVRLHLNAEVIVVVRVSC